MERSHVSSKPFFIDHLSTNYKSHKSLSDKLVSSPQLLLDLPAVAKAAVHRNHTSRFRDR